MDILKKFSAHNRQAWRKIDRQASLSQSTYCSPFY